MEVQVKIFISLAIVSIAAMFYPLYYALVAKPKKLRSLLRKQGINGPQPTFLLGNILEIIKKSRAPTTPKALEHGAVIRHAYTNALFPFIQQWQKEYGNLFVFSLGNRQVIHVTKPDMVREIVTCTSLDFGKSTLQGKMLDSLLGQGIVQANGTKWAYQRKIIAPELLTDKVKGMVKLIQDSSITLANSWNTIIESSNGTADIKIDQHLKIFSGDVITKACFGSNYSDGEKILSRLGTLREVIAKNIFATAIPGMRYLPTKKNSETRRLEREMRTLILNVLKGERNEDGSEKGLLNMILEVAKGSGMSQDALDSFIVDNCKNILVAGHGTNAVSAAWCLMLLAANPEWQERVRAEVLDACKGQIPDGDMIRKMKFLEMAIKETLRLYSPVPLLPREILKEIKLGNITIPEGVIVWTFALTLHTDPEIWGTDSYEFNPDRFANGINGACKFPHLYMPFGFGPRVCLGQNMAMVELKILLSLILSNFSFTLSPAYIHEPVFDLVVKPKHGINLYVKKL